MRMYRTDQVWNKELKKSLTLEGKTKCCRCLMWVKCEKDGFCQCKPLFTFTAKKECSDYIEGKPLTVIEWEKL